MNTTRSGLIRLLSRIGLVAVWGFNLYEAGDIVFSELVTKPYNKPSLPFGRKVGAEESGLTTLRSWSTDPVPFRWSLGEKAAIEFWEAYVPGDSECYCAFETAGLSKPQRVGVAINGRDSTPFVVQQPGSYRSAFPCRYLQRGQNTVELRFPGVSSPTAKDPNLGDRRLLGIALKSFLVDYSRIAWVRYDSNDAGFSNWCGPESGFRWSCAAEMRISFKTASDISPNAACNYKIGILMAMGEQTTKVSINGASLGTWRVPPGGADISQTAPCALLRTGENNIVLEVSKPTKPTGALDPASHDDRPLGVALRDFTVEPSVGK